MKRLLAVVLVLMMVLSLSAAAFAEGSVKPLTLKYAHNKNEESYTHKAALVFQEKCAELSDGAIKIEIYANSQLGDETEVRDGLIMGTVDMGSVATGNMASIANEFTMFDVPYLITTDEQVNRILLDPESPVRQALDEGAYKGGIKVLSWADAGFRCFANNVRPLEVPADLEGVKMRTPSWPMLMAVVEHFKGVPTSMPFSEVYLALQQGVVDGFEQPLWGIVQQNMYEVVKYVSAAKAATDWQTNEIRQDTAGFVDFLRKQGVEVSDELDYDLWSSETAFVLDEYADSINMDVVKLVQDMK